MVATLVSNRCGRYRPNISADLRQVVFLFLMTELPINMETFTGIIDGQQGCLGHCNL